MDWKLRVDCVCLFIIERFEYQYIQLINVINSFTGLNIHTSDVETPVTHIDTHCVQQVTFYNTRESHDKNQNSYLIQQALLDVSFMCNGLCVTGHSTMIIDGKVSPLSEAHPPDVMHFVLSYDLGDAEQHRTKSIAKCPV